MKDANHVGDATEDGLLDSDTQQANDTTSTEASAMTSGDDHGQGRQRLDRLRLALNLLATPIFLALVLFLPAGTLHWMKGWLFFLMLHLAGALAALYLWRVNPEVLVARSRIHEGTKGWDRILLWFLFPPIVAIFVVAAMDDESRGFGSPPRK